MTPVELQSYYRSKLDILLCEVFLPRYCCEPWLLTSSADDRQQGILIDFGWTWHFRKRSWPVEKRTLSQFLIFKRAVYQ